MSVRSVASPTAEYVLTCHTGDALSVHNILQTINFRPSQRDLVAFVEASEKGLKFTVERSNTLQADVYMKSDMFANFRCRGVQTFGINLSTLLDCLNIYGNTADQVSLQICYAGEGNPFQLVLEESGVVSTCDVHPIESSGPTDFGFKSSDVVDRFIIGAATLKDAIGELAWWGDSLRLQLTPEEPCLRMSATGSYGTCQIEYPSDADVFDMFSCSRQRTQSYKFTLLQCLNKALATADKVAVRLNADGMLSVQAMLKGPVVTFSEFFVCADSSLDYDDGDDME